MHSRLEIAIPAAGAITENIPAPSIAANPVATAYTHHRRRGERGELEPINWRVNAWGIFLNRLTYGGGIGYPVKADKFDDMLEAEHIKEGQALEISKKVSSIVR